MTKKLLSIAALTALLSTGASVFDMNTNGDILASIKKSNKSSYFGGEEANASLQLGTARRGDALIYPAFRADKDWTTTISLRNTRNVAVIAKAVLYAKKDSHELKDFNLYLSPHDVAKFTIHDGKITSTDDSIAYEVIDPIHQSDKVNFASEKKEFSLNIDTESGYVIIYGMAEQEETKSGTKSEQDQANNAYHNKHVKLFQDYRKMLDICRDNDNNVSTMPSWRNTFNSPQGGYADNRLVLNGSAIGVKVGAPNVKTTCEDSLVASKKIGANFISPSSKAMFGEVTMSRGGDDKRSLVLPASPLVNYTTDNQMMLWAEGEYAAIQDRRIFAGTGADGFSDYNKSGLKEDAKTFVVHNAYFTFDKKGNECKNDYAFILTQPMKRPLVMALGSTSYWAGVNLSAGNWGYYTINEKKPWTEREESPTANNSFGFVQLNSPLDGKPPKKDDEYSLELSTFTYSEMLEGADTIGDEDYGFETGDVAGYVDMKLNKNKGIPAIVTEMSSHDVEGEAQINWFYSATDK